MLRTVVAEGLLFSGLHLVGISEPVASSQPTQYNTNMERILLLLLVGFEHMLSVAEDSAIASSCLGFLPLMIVCCSTAC